MTLFSRLVRRVLSTALACMNPGQAEGVLGDAAGRMSDRMPAADALRFLLRLDHRLYELEGRKAVEYGGGVHTKHRHTGYHDFFVTRVHPGERVLDVGCGNGALALDLAAKSGASVVGIDRNVTAIEQAQTIHSHPGIEYRSGDILFDIPDQHFDVAICSNILEHLADRPGFLRRVLAATTPARVLVRVPLFERDWRVPLRRELGIEWRLDHTHETEYTIESFDAEMLAAGLVPIHREIRWGEIWAEMKPAGHPG